MIDLETLSTSPTAVVTQLGYAFFEPRGDGVQMSGAMHLEVSAQMERGLSVDWNTISWWLVQDEAARKLLVESERYLPSEALSKLDKLFADFRPDGVWSHGATFDLVILANLYRTAKRKEPWGFKAARDTRTLFWLAGHSLEWAPNTVKHSAEADAVAQAITVQRAIKLIEGRSTCTLSASETSTTA